MKNIQNYEYRPDLFYHPVDHYWLERRGEVLRIGLDSLIQESMGNFVGIQLKKPGTSLKAGESMGSLEAEKHVAHLRAPVSGTIQQINPQLAQTPSLINTDAYENGWILEIEPTDFEGEKQHFLTGEQAVKPWFESEIKKYREKEWLAEP